MSGLPAGDGAAEQSPSLVGEADEAEDVPIVNEAGEQRDVTFAVAHQLRFALALVAVGTFHAAVTGPSALFIKLSFFAERHGGGDCNLEPTSAPCREASSDAAVYHGVSGALAHSFAWLFALLLGSYSDEVGRRPPLIIAGALSFLSGLALAMHLFAGASLWVFLVVQPLVTVFDVTAVFVAMMNDVVKNPAHRVVAHSLAFGVMVASGGSASVLGSALPGKVAIVISLAAGVAQFAFLFCCFTETAPVRLQHSISPGGSRWALEPVGIIRDSVQLLLQSSLIFRMTLVLLLSAMASTGFYSTQVSYLTAYLGFNQATNGQMMVVCGISIALAFLLGMKPLLATFGEYSAMRICLVLKIALFTLSAAAWNQTQLFVVKAVLVGPVLLVVPIMSAIQSNLVGEADQGKMQGVLAACKTIANATGDVFFAWLYRLATDSGRNPNRTAALPPFAVSIGLTAVASGLAFSLRPNAKLGSAPQSSVEFTALAA